MKAFGMALLWGLAALLGLGVLAVIFLGITVRFDRPTALQIDGETILNVMEYQVRAGE